ncbi:MAG: metallophosphoesterase [Ruminococcus sp.]|uniref:metallophosphoesterase n=1 Tax=Ruminococcus sp. TaxID=41978 RepID=UPI0025FB42BF|nr:metallophosphoesterase [Ruminococcus sp.]MBR5683882.1 metallophosphoesterase [Ruminococcus sp.]
MNWILLFAILLLMSVGGTVYLITRFHRFSFIEKLGGKHRLLSWLASILPLGGIACLGFINFYSVIVVILHLIIFWLIADLFAFIVRKAAKKERRRNTEGVCVLLFTAVYLCIGWYNAHNIIVTPYSVTTDKTIDGGSIKVAGFADSHIGITLDGDGMARQIERIQAEDPDIVVIAGDFADDDSKRSDMVKACEALGKLHTTYGVYFVSGNHDKGYMPDSRDFTIEELYSELEKNNVTVLEDEAVMVTDNFAIIGRKDKHDESRKAVSELTKDIPSSVYTLVLDHQPNDYNNEAAANVDLVYSGHTHGGHIWPSGYVGLWIGANDFVYGHTKRSNTDFIVTSGISGWAIPFKTGTVSEYNIINIKGRE